MGGVMGDFGPFQSLGLDPARPITARQVGASGAVQVDSGSSGGPS